MSLNLNLFKKNTYFKGLHIKQKKVNNHVIMLFLLNVLIQHSISIYYQCFNVKHVTNARDELRMQAAVSCKSFIDRYIYK